MSSGFLGWRDVGSVLLTKSDAQRRKGDELREEQGGRTVPAFTGAIMSRRQHRPSRRENTAEEREREEAEAFPTEATLVFAKKPENRLKWLQRGLLIACKGRLKLAVLYDIVTHRKFVAGVSEGIGGQMKALLVANLHLFSPKQQKTITSESSTFSTFTVKPTSGAKRASSARTAAASQKKRGGRDRSGSSGKSKTSSEDSSDEGSSDPPAPKVPRKAGGDPRLFSRGAADDLE